MTQPSYPNSHTVSAMNAFPLPRFITRTRREIDPVDAINARQFEHWQTNAPSGIYNRPDMNKSTPFYDMLPNTSRMSDKKYSSQPRYNPDLAHNVNPYFDKYDTASDARNMAREIQASVYEDKNTGYKKEADKMLERNFDNRWFKPNEAIKQAWAAEQLRPKMDDIRIYYS